MIKLNHNLLRLNSIAIRLPHGSPPPGRISCYKPNHIENCRTNKRCVTPRPSPPCGCGIVAGVCVSVTAITGIKWEHVDKIPNPGQSTACLDPFEFRCFHFCNLFSGCFPFVCLLLAVRMKES